MDDSWTFADNVVPGTPLPMLELDFETEPTQVADEEADEQNGSQRTIQTYDLYDGGLDIVPVTPSVESPDTEIADLSFSAQSSFHSQCSMDVNCGSDVDGRSAQQHQQQPQSVELAEQDNSHSPNNRATAMMERPVALYGLQLGLGEIDDALPDDLEAENDTIVLPTRLTLQDNNERDESPRHRRSPRRRHGRRRSGSPSRQGAGHRRPRQHRDREEDRSQDGNSTNHRSSGAPKKRSGGKKKSGGHK